MVARRAGRLQNRGVHGVDRATMWESIDRIMDEPAGANFEIAGLITEVVLLGNIAVRTGKKLYWDGPNMTVINDPEANKYIHREYRAGWSL